MHVVNLFYHHLAPRAAKDRNRVHLGKRVLQHLMERRLFHLAYALLRGILANDRQGVLHRLIGVLVNPPMALHREHVVFGLVHIVANYHKFL